MIEIECVEFAFRDDGNLERPSDCIFEPQLLQLASQAEELLAWRQCIEPGHPTSHACQSQNGATETHDHARVQLSE
jgi:hypothetical protein